jgi:hypothetical protein
MKLKIFPCKQAYYVERQDFFQKLFGKLCFFMI